MPRTRGQNSKPLNSNGLTVKWLYPVENLCYTIYDSCRIVAVPIQLFQNPIGATTFLVPEICDYLCPTMKYTQTTLNKLEKLIEETGYIVRFERGNFQSGFCILEEKKVVVLNKFLPLEGRINTLIDLLPQLNIDAEKLSPESKKVFDDTMRQGISNKE